jgi:hypothetical protein
MELEHLERRKEELLKKREEVSRKYTAEILSKMEEFEEGRKACERDRRYEEYMEGKGEGPLDLDVD